MPGVADVADEGITDEGEARVTRPFTAVLFQNVQLIFQTLQMTLSQDQVRLVTGVVFLNAQGEQDYNPGNQGCIPECSGGAGFRRNDRYPAWFVSVGVTAPLP